MKKVDAILTACLLAALAIFLFFGESRAAIDQIPTQMVVVKPGDTLWSIAVRHIPDEDPRQTIEAIKVLNTLNTPRIDPGQELIVPCCPGRNPGRENCFGTRKITNGCMFNGMERHKKQTWWLRSVAREIVYQMRRVQQVRSGSS